MKDVNEVLVNPVRLRIIQELAKTPRMITQELCDRISDVPKASMYRHIKILLDANIITIVSEKRVRGSMERTLSLNIQEIKRGNTIERASHNALVFLLSKYTQYHAYFSGKAPDPGKDRIFLNTTILMMTDEEYDRFLSELRDLLLRYSFDAKEGRKARDFSLLSAPVDERKE